jgi:hypothetical protein
MRVLKTLKPGAPGTRKWVRKFGKRLICVRYRGDARRRVRLTTVEVVVEEGFWDPMGYENHKRAMSSTRQAVQ